MYNKIIFLITVLGIIMSIKSADSKFSYSSTKLDIISDAFGNNSFIPEKYGCKGENISIPLEWKGAQDGAKSFAILAEDPDVPHQIWVHWILFNIDKNIFKLKENFNIDDYKSKSPNIKEGSNSYKKSEYSGPCPPEGQTHKYVFRIYALDKFLDLNTGASKEELLKAMEGHILDTAELVGLYKK